MASTIRALEVSGQLQRNVRQCAHCGEIFVRLNEEVPAINRSDGSTFHVNLFSGPDRRHRASGGLHKGQANCGFVYVHYQTRPKTHFVVVVMKRAAERLKEKIDQMEQVTDKLADLLRAGKKLGAVYTWDDGQLNPGFPD